MPVYPANGRHAVTLDGCQVSGPAELLDQAWLVDVVTRDVDLPCFETVGGGKKAGFELVHGPVRFPKADWLLAQIARSNC